VLKSSAYPYNTINGKDFLVKNFGLRFHFNGKENDNEVKGDGNWQDYGMRAYDPIIGRPPSIDPLAKEYPYYSPYQFFGNNPILYIDLDGAEPAIKSVRTNNNFSQEARDGQLAGGNRSEHPIVITEVKNQLKIGNLKPTDIGSKMERFYSKIYGSDKAQEAFIGGVDGLGKGVKAFSVAAAFVNPPAALGIYAIGEGITKGADLMKTSVHLEKGEYKEASIEGVGFFVGQGAGVLSDKIKNEAKKVATQAVVDIAVDKTKDASKDAVKDKKQK